MGRYNDGIIFTNQKCIACNKCIASCDIFGANICVSEGKRDFIVVNSQKCTLCGNCIEACPQNARDFHDDSDAFFNALKDGEKITLIIASTFRFHYENVWDKILGYLKSLGVEKIYESSFGEQIAVWATTSYIKENMDKPSNQRAFIANTCPSIVDRIENYYHQLIKKIIPVENPVNCGAIYLQKYLKDNNKIAYLGPCIAQNNKANRKDDKKLIDYNLTFNHFIKKIDWRQISDYSCDFDQTPLKSKNRLAFHGNFRKAVEQFFPLNTNLISLEGYSKDIFDLLINQRYSQNPLSQPYLVDLVSCKNGCHYGSGVDKDNLDVEKLYLKYIQLQQENPESQADKWQEKWEENCLLFKDLDAEDFSRNQKDLYKQPHKIPEEIYDQTFKLLLKDTNAKRHIDCGSCGYKSCYEMAKAIAYGQNKKENCIHYTNAQMFINFFTDVETGLLNRTSFVKNTNEMMMKNPDKSYVILMGDINKLKIINNLYSFSTGNEVLKVVANALKERAGEEGICARMGAGLFCICIENVDEKIKHFLELSTFDCKHLGIEFPVTMRFGVYASNDNNISLMEMMNCANLCMDVNVSNFQNTFTFYNDTYRKTQFQEIEITSRLQRALDNHEFVIWFQPQYKSNSGELVGAEVLCRWTGHDGKMISPDVFIPIAEKNGFIKKIDAEIWQLAFTTMSKWIKNNVKLLPISINISRINLENDNFIYTIMNLARDYDIPPRLIHFEITESAYMTNQKNMINRINKLRNLGYKIAMDDFGSGYSSLNTLKDMPIDILKLDMGFLKEQSNMDKGGKIISSLAQMAQNLGYETIAEGVETQEQADFLKGIGIDIIQGFLYSRPIQENKYLELLDSQSRVAEIETSKTEQLIQINNFYNVNSNESIIFDKLLGPAAIFDFNQKNNKLQLLRVNQKALKICGLTNISNGRLQRYLKSFFSQETKDIFLENIKKTIKLNAESIGIFKERDFINNEQIFVKFHITIIEKKDTIYTVFILMEDITEEMNSENSLVSSNTYITDLIENSNAAISLMHLQFDPMNINKKLILKLLKVNKEFENITGYSQKDILTFGDKKFFDFIHPMDRPFFIRKLLQAYANNFLSSNSFNFRFQKHNGRYERIKILINAIKQKDDSYILFSTFILQER